MDQKSNREIAINIYSVVDNELHRMHILMQHYITLPSGRNDSMTHLGTIYRRIIDLQNIILEEFKGHDKLIQEKVAELALTGDSDSETK